MGRLVSEKQTEKRKEKEGCYIHSYRFFGIGVFRPSVPFRLGPFTYDVDVLTEGMGGWLIILIDCVSGRGRGRGIQISQIFADVLF